jgi:hypothetical protein
MKVGRRELEAGIWKPEIIADQILSSHIRLLISGFLLLTADC